MIDDIVGKVESAFLEHFSYFFYREPWTLVSYLSIRGMRRLNEVGVWDESMKKIIKSIKVVEENECRD